MTLAVENPAIGEVLDLRDGECYSAAQVIGSDEDKASQLRLLLRTLIDKSSPRYVCPECGVPIYLACMSSSRTFFFKHDLEDNRCSAVTRGPLSQDEIDARKYNGAKESDLHLQMKEWLVKSIEVDSRFSDIAIEQRWKGNLTGQWRKPDVRATCAGKRIAFEIQLSTTHLPVISRRRQFYLQEGGLLFWVFARFNESSRRLTQDDVFYNNNQNAFLVSPATVAASIDAKALHFQCVWAEPVSPTEVAGLKHRIISFHDLHINYEQQQVYHFDFYGHRNSLLEAEVARRRTLRNDFEEHFLAYMRGDRDNEARWWTIRKRLRAERVVLPIYESQLPRSLLMVLYTFKYGKPTACDLKTFIEVAHLVTNTSNRRYLRHSRAALAAFNRGTLLESQDKSGKWNAKVLAYKAAIGNRDPDYAPDSTHDSLIDFLFPELEEFRKTQHLARNP